MVERTKAARSKSVPMVGLSRFVENTRVESLTVYLESVEQINIMF